MKKIIAIVGARPQFIKHAAIDLAAQEKLNLVTIHTGQHYDENMSKIFFDQLKISRPKYSLETGGMSHGKQTGLMMSQIEPIIIDENPDGVLLYGDTNSTLAGSLVAAKLKIPVIHVEAGLRSYNKKMPEEINRILTDHCSSMLLTTSDVANDNLASEGIVTGVYKVGDVMLDVLNLSKQYCELKDQNEYYYCTLHRPYNVDDKARLEYILTRLNQLSRKVLFTIHPRTKAKCINFEIDLEEYSNINFVEPASYFSNIENLMNSSGLITDSGGMQKEAYWLEKRCITIRSETEWVETIESGWNTLLYEDLSNIDEEIKKIPDTHDGLYGDGHASERIVNVIMNHEEI